MATVWFAIISLMLATYVVLDGFDFGVGILHLFITKTENERQTMFAAIGPVWDGNEVWLLATGGSLVFAFPRVYAAAFSGYYLALMMVLWLLILRGTSIEFRSHQENHLWRSFWDGVFAFSSCCLAIVLGAAFGTVIRGVPIDETGYFSGPLFTDFRIGTHPGILDWYTVLVGVFSLLTLAAHGATYLLYKTSGDIRDRSRKTASALWIAVVGVGALTTFSTWQVRPGLYLNLLKHPLGWFLIAITFGGLASVFASLRRKNEISPFVASSTFLVGILGATAAGLFPNILTSTVSPTFSMTVANSASGHHGLQVGLVWWTPALLLAIVYFTYLFRSFRGKVIVDEGGHG